MGPAPVRTLWAQLPRLSRRECGLKVPVSTGRDYLPTRDIRGQTPCRSSRFGARVRCVGLRHLLR